MCIGLKRRTGDALKLAQPTKKFTPSTSCGNKKAKHHITIQHNYHDHAGEIQVEYKHIKGKGGVLTPFPLKLHAMLDAVERQGMEHIVSWQPHGRCFVVHNPKAFVDILSNHFKVSKLSSFQRQLNLYGFSRITAGADRGGYYHELFLRNKVFLCQNMVRRCDLRLLASMIATINMYSHFTPFCKQYYQKGAQRSRCVPRFLRLIRDWFWCYQA